MAAKFISSISPSLATRTLPYFSRSKSIFLLSSTIALHAALAAHRSRADSPEKPATAVLGFRSRSSLQKFSRHSSECATSIQDKGPCPHTKLLREQRLPL